MGVLEIIRKAIEIGQPDGEITFDELDQLCGKNIAAEDIEDIFFALSEAGIRLVEERG
ncbi:RNA polymerase sigma factor region1.1 domain-containing protein [Bradyrhizobium sp. HKCCYLS1011]|uniref:RNA polymerase sigma factor region1.1 domain-containing protein n=1 Tax=Bradyrhizobium sp. HKCCYLS1011 TaxID=3420733 RepID=UPI003EBACD6B